MDIYGKAVAAKVKANLKNEITQFIAQTGKTPCLAVIIVGDDPASQTYVRNKIAGCAEVGIKSLSQTYSEGTAQSTINAKVSEWAADADVDGILVQLPLPKGYDEKAVLSLIPDDKDVDGFGATNIGRLALGRAGTVSCTPLGVMKMLGETGIELRGKNAVVIGRSNTVGKPMAMLLLNADCTVTVCHSKTQNLAEITSRADVLVAAIGKPKFVTQDMVKDGAVVIDVGINRVDGKLCGDVDYDAVSKKASYISPVPGGVGPMTISMLLQNTLECAKLRLENR